MSNSGELTSIQLTPAPLSRHAKTTVIFHDVRNCRIRIIDHAQNQNLFGHIRIALGPDTSVPRKPTLPPLIISTCSRCRKALQTSERRWTSGSAIIVAMSKNVQYTQYVPSLARMVDSM